MFHGIVRFAKSESWRATLAFDHRQAIIWAMGRTTQIRRREYRDLKEGNKPYSPANLVCTAPSQGWLQPSIRWDERSDYPVYSLHELFAVPSAIHQVNETYTNPVARGNQVSNL